jgi:hypothetical protein
VRGVARDGGDGGLEGGWGRQQSDSGRWIEEGGAVRRCDSSVCRGWWRKAACAAAAACGLRCSESKTTMKEEDEAPMVGRGSL